MMNISLNKRAVGIMTANDRGGYTVPTARLYPYQWNWDSAFAALGFSCFDRKRAWSELDSLFAGQWSDGMVPHIIFRQNDETYFPGPQMWESGTQPPSSGYSQPPVAASIMARLVFSGDDEDLRRAEALFERAMAWHRWYHEVRDPESIGVIGVVHPWESGRDNCPDWDVGMDAVAIAPDLQAYRRRDIDHVDAAERPSKDQYDRYMTLVQFGRQCGWDQRKIVRDGPFFMADPGIQFILMRADRDLLQLAKRFSRHEAVAELEGWIGRSEAGCHYLWNEDAGGFCARDFRSGNFSSGITNASMLAFYGGAGNTSQRSRLIGELNRIAAAVEYTFPSWDPQHPAFESRRYWRGPVWAVMNFMGSAGLKDAGEERLAARIRQDTLRLIELSGFCEYFDPISGAGLGGDDFTWTAAIWLAWSGDDAAVRAA